MDGATQNSSTEDFVNAITELVDFETYFTDERQSAILIDWLVEDWGISRFKAHLLVKRIAPFVIARAGQIGNILGESTRQKIQAYFNKFNWYFNLTQKLLNLLKTRNDKSFENALANPTASELEAITENNKLWESLKPEYQALVQILLNQTELLNNLDYLRNQLNDEVQNIIQELSYNLDLISPSHSLSLINKNSKSFANWLVYTHQQVPLLGRDHSLKMLDQFFDQTENFSWWAITGAGGTGKSRLAFDAIQKREETGEWDVGFLPKIKLHDPDALSRWQQKKPTIIVIDYAGDSPDAIDHCLSHFTQHQHRFAYPVRLLLLERYSKQQDWWKKLLQQGSQSEIRFKTLFSGSPHELAEITDEIQKQILQNFLQALQSTLELPEKDHEFWKHFKHLSNNGRPLFIGMIAIAIHKKGIHHVRHWTQGDLLQSILAHEEKNWAIYFKQDDKEAIYTLLALNTMTLGYIQSTLKNKKENKLINGLKKCEILPGEKTRTVFARYKDIINNMAGNRQGYLQPDILAEFFVLKQWQCQDGEISSLQKDLLKLAYKSTPTNTGIFITRCATDFFMDKTSYHWWLKLRQLKKKQPFLDTVAFAIIGQLSLFLHPEFILKQWLPILCESKNKKTKANALNWTGLLKVNIGDFDKALALYKKSLKLYKKIGDKLGEDRILNNISQIYDARGEYETALRYLQQSLEIQQEIGDKSGEGTTLNNISAIYNARGDNETALIYFKQSLEIQQEIGDKSSEGKILNNISVIYNARGDYKTALRYLQQSLEIQKEIGDKSGEGTTYNNISAIYNARGDNETALHYLEQSLEITQEIGDKLGEGLTLNNISQIYDVRSDHKMASHYLEQSLEIQQEIGDKSGEGTTLNNMATSAHARGDNETALRYFKQSLEIQHEIGDKSGEGRTLNNITLIYFARGDYVTALRYLEQSLEIQQEIDDNAGMCATLFNMGRIQYQNEKIKEAFKTWGRVYTLAKPMGFAQALDALDKLAGQLGLPDGLDSWKKFTP